MDYILAGLIVLLLVKQYFDERENKAERERLMRALMAKTLTDYTASEILKDEPKEETLPDAIPEEAADDSIFEKHIKEITRSEEDEKLAHDLQ